MLGASFRRRPKRFTTDGFYDPHPARTSTRVSNVYALPWHLPDDSEIAPVPPSRHLRLGRNQDFYTAAIDQLPMVLHSTQIDPARLAFSRWTRPNRIRAAKVWLFSTPSRRLVAALTLDTRLPLSGVIDLLEDCYYVDLRLDDQPFEAVIADLAARCGARSGEKPGFLAERHQIAFGPALPERNCDDIVQRIIYRKDLPYRKEFSSIRYPSELNRRPGNTVAVGPYVSAICGHQNDVENSALISAVQAVASAARLREIRQAAYEAVASFRRLEHAAMPLPRRRRVLEDLADNLAHMEVELSHSVEATADIGLLVPSLRVESYHVTLFEAMDLSARAAIAARMLDRLDRAIGGALTTVQSIERRNDDARRLRWAVAVGLVSTVAIPLTLILAFFGINAAEVDAERSIFDPVYLGAYLAITLILVVSILPAFGLYLRHKRHVEEP